MAFIAYSNYSSLLMIGLVNLTRSKYASVATTRFAVLGAMSELFFSALFLFLFIRAGGYSADAVMELDPIVLFGTPPLALCLILFVLFEAKRAPMDHTEAESELVAGHLVEFGGRTLLVFFVCEYLHVYFCLFALVTLVLGGGSFAGSIPFCALVDLL